MTPWRENLRHLRAAIAIASVVGAISVSLFWLASERWSAHRAARVANEQRDRQALRELIELDSSLRIAGSHQSMFGELASAGVIGEFHKTVALDRFEEISRRFAPIVLSWTVGARSFVEPALPGLRSYALARRSLSFEAQPLHGVEFLRLWQVLSRQSGGLSSIDACSLARPRTGRDPGSDGPPRLKVRCTLSWFNFDVPDQPIAAQSSLGAAPPPSPESLR